MPARHHAGLASGLPSERMSAKELGGSMEREADVVIVGAGLSGLIAAREILAAGKEPSSSRPATGLAGAS